MPIETSPYETCHAVDIITCEKDAIHRLAMAMIITHAEFQIEMVKDCANEYPSKQKIEKEFTDLTKDTLERLDEWIDCIRDNLKERLTTMKVDARVTQLKYNLDGDLIDITVAIDQHL